MPQTINRQVRILIAVLLVALAGYIAGGPLPKAATHTQTHAATTIDSNTWYPLVRVSDGDTIVVKYDGADLPVRLIGINTPEVKGPYTKEECFGPEASAETKKITGAGSVRLETDPSQDLYDQYDRLLAYVYVPANVRSEGIMLNEYLVQEGFAREYTFKKPYAHQSEFKADQAAARVAKKGLWAACIAS